MAYVRTDMRRAQAAVEPVKLTGIHVGRVMVAGFLERMVNMFHVAFFIAKKERPFTDFPDLVELQERTGSKMATVYRSDMAVAR